MKLIVLHSTTLDAADVHLIRLAQFLGGQCEMRALPEGAVLTPRLLEKLVPDRDACLVINPAVLQNLLSSEPFPQDLASFLLSRFPYLLVHNLGRTAFSSSIIRTLSGERLQSVSSPEGTSLTYQVADASQAICGHFAGLKFGPVDIANDRVLVENPHAGAVQALISIAARPLFAKVQIKQSDVFFLAGNELADIDASWNARPLVEFFSRLLPAAMSLRHIFGANCWRPYRHHATVIIDDPILWRNYGFLNFAHVLELMDRHNFHTSIAFIPYNCRRNLAATARLFRERPDRYSICVHGNDHTGAEFAAKDIPLLNSMLAVADSRLAINQCVTGIECDRVMVFPQGNFSRAAMEALGARNFYAAVNTVPFPRGEALNLTLSDVMQPAVLKYAGFPLFLRKYPAHTAPQDIAFNLFFGRPVFIVEHHEIFRNPQPLVDLISIINKLAPEIRWSCLKVAIEDSWLGRRAVDGTFQIQSDSNVGIIENSSSDLLRCSVEWPNRNPASMSKMVVGDTDFSIAGDNDRPVHADFALLPGESRRFSFVQNNGLGMSNANKAFKWKTKVFIRRRLSEFRDNHLSKNPALLSAAKSLHKRLLQKRAPTSEPS